MYIDEPAEDLTVTVEGQDYQAEPTVDLDGDGADDTTVVETDDGSIAFTDTDADGHADLMTRLDADGEIIGRARFDASTGEWVQVDPDDIELAADGRGDVMTVDTGEGEVEVGAPTHDTDGDGRADSVAVQDADGDTVIFTDFDEDGDADYATEITERGQVVISEHAGDGEWTVVERGHLDDGGGYRRDPSHSGSPHLDSPHSESPHSESGTVSDDGGWSSGRPDAAEVHVDPRTGGWTRD